MKPWHKLALLSLLGLLFAHAVLSTTMRWTSRGPAFLAALSFLPVTEPLRDFEACGANTAVSLSWYPPARTPLNNLDLVMYNKGVYDFIYNSSKGPLNDYNFCNMPRANPTTWPRAGKAYTLEYVELIARHHKRTPYAANLFPGERADWACDDEMIFYGGQPLRENAGSSASTYWSVYTTDSNPFTPLGRNGTCQFPQITSAGLMDSYGHGFDSKQTYSWITEFISGNFTTSATSYRVTNNVITSQVASKFIMGMWEGQLEDNMPLLVQPEGIDSLEPSYSCPAADKLLAAYGPGSESKGWLAHLTRTEDLRQRLNSITGIDSTDSGWSDSWDHYYDNFAARLCHGKPLPCSALKHTECVTMEEANTVFRLGQYEYSFIYRDAEESLRASVASYGIYLGELVQNLRSFMSEEQSATASATTSRVFFRHNVAHDGSIARLLSILQINYMVWPGMGAELAFELFSKAADFDKGIKCYFLRVLWGGQVLRSSHPDFQRMDMIPIGTFLAYIDGLVGVKGSKIPAMCAGDL